MFYGFCSLFSLLIYGSNYFESIGIKSMQTFFTDLGYFVSWFSGHFFGVDTFYSRFNDFTAYDFYSWLNGIGHSNSLYTFLPGLLAFICTIIVTWGLVRLIVKVCSLGKITY